MNATLHASPTSATPRSRAASPGLRASLAHDHVLAVLMDEHQRLLAKLDRLEEIAS